MSKHRDRLRRIARTIQTRREPIFILRRDLETGEIRPQAEREIAEAGASGRTLIVLDLGPYPL